MSSAVLFRRVSVLTAVFAYLQIALGGVVRVSGSGLGCPDWPLCQGRPYPPANLHSIIEYSHRLVGTITGVLIIATVILAWVVFRSRRPVVAWLATASLVAVAFEGALGGLVVAQELAPWLVAVHLGLAMVILGSLIAAAVLSMPAAPDVVDRAFKRLAAIAVVATYVLLLTGSAVVATNADTSCKSWPLCGGGLAPSLAGVDAVTMLHRGTVLVAGLVLVYFCVTAWRRAAAAPGMRFFAAATLVVLALQVAVGAGAAITDAALANGLHVAMATLLWSGVLTAALLALPRADRQPIAAQLRAERTAV
jgi:heme A synthase